MRVERKVIEENIVTLGLEFSQLKDGVDEYEIVPSLELEKLVLDYRRIREQIKTYEEARIKFLKASEELTKLVDFNDAPMKAGMTLMSIIKNPQKYQNQLGPILDILRPNKQLTDGGI